MMADNDVKRSVHSGLKTLCLALGKIDDGEIEGDFGLGDSLESDLEISESSEEFEEVKQTTVKMEQIKSHSVHPPEASIGTDRVPFEMPVTTTSIKKQGC